jgi:hypothetical protein
MTDEGGAQRDGSIKRRSLRQGGANPRRRQFGRTDHSLIRQTLGPFQFLLRVETGRFERATQTAASRPSRSVPANAAVLESGRRAGEALSATMSGKPTS